jgi:DNA gyrase/topoisomerase IV subunit A
MKQQEREQRRKELAELVKRGQAMEKDLEEIRKQLVDLQRQIEEMRKRKGNERKMQGARCAKGGKAPHSDIPRVKWLRDHRRPLPKVPLSVG